MAHEGVETTHSIKNVFGWGYAKKHTTCWWFKKFCKGDNSLEVEERSSQPSAVDNNHLRAIIKADSLTTTEVAEELSVNPSMVVQHLKQIGKVKKLDKWVAHELTPQNKCHFEVLSSLILCNNGEPFLNQIMTLDGKWIWDDNWQQPAQWLDREEAAKHFQNRTFIKNPSCHCLVLHCRLVHYDFLNPGKSITSEKYAQQIDEMYWKLQSLQLALVNGKGPILHDSAWPHVASQKLQKLDKLGNEFCLILCICLTSCQPTTTPSKHLDNFL